MHCHLADGVLPTPSDCTISLPESQLPQRFHRMASPHQDVQGGHVVLLTTTVGYELQTSMMYCIAQSFAHLCTACCLIGADGPATMGVACTCAYESTKLLSPTLYHGCHVGLDISSCISRLTWRGPLLMMICPKMMQRTTEYDICKTALAR